MKSYLLFTPIMIILFSSCTKEFSINSNWTDNTIVMGLLSSTDTVQYIKINKSFLGNGDVYEMAKESDSIQYNEIVNVRLVEYSIISTSGSPYDESNWKTTDRDTILLERTSAIEKSPFDSNGELGSFGTDENFLYMTHEVLRAGLKYKLLINIPGKHEVVWAETFMISNLVTTKPSKNEPITTKVFIEKAYSMMWKSAIYGKIYQPKIRFNYIEFANGDTVDKSVVIEYPMQTVDALRTADPYETGMDIEQSVGGSEFYRSLAQKIEENHQVGRRFKSLDFIFLVGGNDFNTYLNVSNTELGYGQSTPEYSNIQNGYGLFDNRYHYEVKNKIISNTAIDSLVNGSITKHLSFDINLAN